MTAEAIYRYDEGTRRWKAGSDYQPGQVVQTPDNLAGVIQGLDANLLKSGSTVAAAVKGVFEVAAASGTTFSAGVAVDWDDTNNVVVATGTGTFALGKTVAAKSSGETSVLVSLNA